MVCKMWTLEEENKLREVFPTYSKEELEKEFGRGYNSIRQKAIKLNIKRESNVQDGFCICKQCKRKLPWKPEYFPKLKSEKNLRQICRECNPKYGSFIEVYKSNFDWTSEKEDELKRVYRQYNDKEILKMDIFEGLTLRKLRQKANSLGLYKKERKEYGLAPLFPYLRIKMTEWKENSISMSKGKCVITGKDYEIVHHLTPFREMVNQALKNANLPKKRPIEYSEEELDKLIEELKLIHKQEPGVCLTEKVHIEFHKQYGLRNFTKEDFEEFKKLYANKE